MLFSKPLGVEDSLLTNAFIGVRSEIVALCLDQVGWHSSASERIEITERCGERRYCNSRRHSGRLH